MPKARISTSKIYKIFERLQQKGLVGHIIKGKKRYFQALDPQRLLEYIEEKEAVLLDKKSRIKQLLPQLRMAKEMSGKQSDAVVYSGFRAISNFYRQILTELHSGEEYYVLGANYGEDMPGVRGFFHNHHLARARKNIRLRMLANNNIKSALEPSTFRKARIRFLPQYLAPNMVVVFYKNKSFLFFLTKEPKGFLIESSEVAQGFRQYFEVLWGIAKE